MKTCDCENCPLSWEERSYEGECGDCGCLIYGDLYEGDKLLCKFPEWLKWKIAKHKQAKIDRKQAKQYDDIGEWYAQEQKKECAMRTAIKEVLLTDRYDGERFICHESNGKLYKLDTDSILLDGAGNLIDRYDELMKESEAEE